MTLLLGEAGTAPAEVEQGSTPVCYHFVCEESQTMLFYIKRYLSLEIVVTLLLGGFGYWAIRRNALAFNLRPSPQIVALGFAGSLWLAVWTRLVQYGYALARGKAYAERLTATLAREYANASPVQIVFGGLTAACGEEIFFRGFVQQAFGIVAASLLFMLAHFGKKEIRTISLWSIFQGLYLGLFFAWSKNLLVPMIAHALFDAGGMIYFRRFMARLEPLA
jgi:membrane protease YdiL (CAAX protease family)